MPTEGEIIGDFILIRQLGSGSFATVWLAKHIQTEQLVAIKLVQKSSLGNEDSNTRFNREVSLLKKMDHPFIAPLFEIIEDPENYYLVMEYVENGNMLNFVNTQGRLAEDITKKYFAQVVSAIDYMHNVRYVAHRDLKAENVLLDRNFNIRLIDFGLSNQFSRGAPNLVTACGSPAYAAPEMISGSQYNKAADIWSIGILLYAMVVGVLPFDDPNLQELLQKIVYTEVQYPPTLSRSLTDLLKRLLCKSPQTRITIQEVKKHPWFLQTSYQLVMHFPFHTNESWVLSDTLIFNTVAIDRETMRSVADLGLDVNHVVEDLTTDSYTPPAIAYKIIRRNRITEQIRELMANLTRKVDTPSFQERSPFSLTGPPMGPSAGRGLGTLSAQFGTLAPAGVRRLGTPLPELPTIRRLSRPVAVRRFPANFVKPQSLETP